MLVRTHYLRGLCLRFTFIISLLSSGYANAAPVYSYKVVATYLIRPTVIQKGSSISMEYFTRVAASMDALL